MISGTNSIMKSIVRTKEISAAPNKKRIINMIGKNSAIKILAGKETKGIPLILMWDNLT